MKTNFRRFLAVLYVVVFLIVVYLSNAINHSISPAKVINKTNDAPYNDDLQFFKNDLPKLHPNLFYKYSKSDYYNKLNYLTKNQSKYSINDMRLELMKLTASVEDGHTTAYVKSAKYFPFSATWFDDNSLRITAVTKEYKKYLGYKISKVNNLPINDVIKKLDAVTPNESSNWLKSKASKSLRNYELLKLLGIASNNTITLALKDFSNKSFNVKFKAINKQDFKKLVFLDLLYNQKNVPAKPKKSNQNYWHAYDKDNKIFYFKYKSCMDAATAKSIGESQLSYSNDINLYFNSLIKDFNNSDAEKFIIDLRDNGGGNPELIKYLISNLAVDPKFKNIADKNNRLFIFTNESTFSAGVFAGIDFKNAFPNSKIIGTSTGGLKTVFSNPKTKVLKNTNMYLSYATDIYPNNKTMDRMPLIPDIESLIKLRDALIGIDYDYKLVKDSNIN